MSNRSHNITSQMDLFHKTSVQLLCLAGQTGTDVKQIIHHHITNGHFSIYSCSALCLDGWKATDVIQITHHQITIESSSSDFCSAPVLGWTDGKRCQTDHTPSHHKWIFSSTLVFSSCAVLNRRTTMSTRSQTIASQMNLFQDSSVQLLCLAGPTGSNVNQSTHHHITNGSFPAHFCSAPVLG